MREPKQSDLIEYVCQIQPELDPTSAEMLLALDESVRAWIAQRWNEQRVTGQALLDLHLDLMKASA